MPLPLPRYLIGAALACVAFAAGADAQLRADTVVTGLSQPVAFVQDPSDATVQLVVEQNGRIRVVRNGQLLAADYLDLRSVVRNAGEQGLLGLAFAPNYATSGRVFVNFINLNGDTVIARFTRAAGDPVRADPSSRFDLLFPPGQRVIPQPFANHNGGHLAFGPDGYLYIGMGDGGSGNDPMHLAQNPQSLLGKMLRIDVNVPANDTEGYNVPATNPFVGQSGVLTEIWSFGLRNPWRWSFDNVARGGTGAMLIGDVGQNSFEEIDYEPAGRGGRNYGWRNREGAHNNVTSLAPFSQPLVDPIHEYPRSSGQSVTGGYVYRGFALGAATRGRYFFADFVSSRIWSISLTINGNTGEATAGDLQDHTSQLGNIANPSSFGEDASGELYVVSYGGTIHRIASTDAPITTNYPKRRPTGVAPVGFAAPRPAPAAPAAPAIGAAKTPLTAPAPAPIEAMTAAPRARWAVIRDEHGAIWVVVEDDEALTPADVQELRHAIARLMVRRP
jgi:glucose/arabinose dehydrogenase